MFLAIQAIVLILIAVVGLIASVWGLIDAARYQSSTFVAAGKQTKMIWVLILVAAVVVSILAMPTPIGMGRGIFTYFALAALAATAVYFAGVRPALRDHEPRRGGSDRSSGGSTGGW